MDDSGPRLPEPDSILGSGRGQEVVHLLVRFYGFLEVLSGSRLGLDEMVTVDGGGNCHLYSHHGDTMATGIKDF